MAILPVAAILQVGASWKINAGVAARNLARAGIQAQPEDITGTATLQKIAEINGTRCLSVRGEMSIKRIATALVPDFKVERAEMHMAYSATFPVDLSKGRLQESQQMRMTCSMRGKPDANGPEVILQSTAERTVATKITHPE